MFLITLARKWLHEPRYDLSEVMSKDMSLPCSRGGWLSNLMWLQVIAQGTYIGFGLGPRRFKNPIFRLAVGSYGWSWNGKVSLPTNFGVIENIVWKWVTQMDLVGIYDNMIVRSVIGDRGCESSGKIALPIDFGWNWSCFEKVWFWHTNWGKFRSKRDLARFEHWIGNLRPRMHLEERG